MLRLTALALGLLLALTGCGRGADPDGLQYALRCGMSREDVTAVAKAHGYVECSVPTATGDVPDYGCRGRSEWVAFWFDGSGLTGYTFGDSNAENCGDESGCSSPYLDLCSGRPAP